MRSQNNRKIVPEVSNFFIVGFSMQKCFLHRVPKTHLLAISNKFAPVSTANRHCGPERCR